MRGRILLVDDEPSILLTLAAILEREGIVIETASSAKEALHKLQTGTYEAVITDMHMETEAAGYEVVHAANAQPYTPITIILTGYASRCGEWQEQGVHALFEKPMNAEELLLAIDNLIREQRQVAAPKIAEAH